MNTRDERPQSASFVERLGRLSDLNAQVEAIVLNYVDRDTPLNRQIGGLKSILPFINAEFCRENAIVDLNCLYAFKGKLNHPYDLLSSSGFSIILTYSHDKTPQIYIYGEEILRVVMADQEGGYITFAELAMQGNLPFGGKYTPNAWGFSPSVIQLTQHQENYPTTTSGKPISSLVSAMEASLNIDIYNFVERDTQN